MVDLLTTTRKSTYFPFENFEERDRYLYKLVNVTSITNNSILLYYKKQNKETNEIQKIYKVIDDPEYEFYVTDHGANVDSKYSMLHSDHVKHVQRCKYKERFRMAYKFCSNETKNRIQSIDRLDNVFVTDEQRHILKDCNVFTLSIPLTMFYKLQFVKEFPSSMEYDSDLSVDIIYSDIETNIGTSFAETGKYDSINEHKSISPIMVMQLMHKRTRLVDVLIDREQYSKYNSYSKFDNKTELELRKENVLLMNQNHLTNNGLLDKKDEYTIDDELNIHINGKMISKDNLRCIDVSFTYFEGPKSELDMIKKYFHIINTSKTDVIYFWNMRFDILTIINRLGILLFGHHMTEKQFEKRELEKDDKKNSETTVRCKMVDTDDLQTKLNMIHSIFLTGSELTFPKMHNPLRYQGDLLKFILKDTKDKFHLVAPYRMCDLGAAYAKMNSAGGVKTSYSLNNVLKEVVNDHKVTYDTNIGHFMTKDANRFISYSIMDVVGMYSIDEKLGTTSNIQNLMDKTTIDMIDAFSTTQFLECYARVYLLHEESIILDSNMNRFFKANKFRFPGGLVGDPTKAPVSVFNTKFVQSMVVDADAESMYPTGIVIQNLSPDNLIGLFLDKNRNRDSLFNDVIAGPETYLEANHNIPTTNEILRELNII